MNLPRSWTVPAVCIALAALTWFVFGPTLGHEFINYDDPQYVLKNRHVTSGLTTAGIAWAFTHVHAGNWHPLTWLSHMVDCELYGLNPRGHHLTSVLLHTASAIVLFLVLLRMTAALWRSAFVAALFAIHPLRVESVAWVAERKDVLSGFFFVLTLAAYVRYARAPFSLYRYGLVLLLFAAGLMSKSMLVSLPLVLLLLDYWPLERHAIGARRLVLEKLPLVGLAAAVSVTTLLAQQVAMGELNRIPLLIRAGNAISSCFVYIRQMFWPAELAAFYPFPPRGLSVPTVALGIVLLTAVSVTVYVLRTRRYLVTGWLWYLLMLAPVIGLVQVGDQAHADRYTYLPQIGLYVAVAWGTAELVARWQAGSVVVGITAAIALSALSVTARAQAMVWQNSTVLWQHALAVTPESSQVRSHLAHAFSESRELEKALAEYERSIALDPRQARVHSQCGAVLLELGRAPAALARFERALELDPRHVDARVNLAAALLQLGRPEEARAHLEHALQIDPADAHAHYNLGNTLLELRNTRAALAQYARALELDPDNTRALNNLAWILATSEDGIRDGAKAVAAAERANALTRGSNAIVIATLAAAYAEAGRFTDALKAGERAVELATREGDTRRAESVRAQIASYRASLPVRDMRYATSAAQ